MKFVSNRNIVVRSLKGHAIEFKKGVPQDVPEVMRDEVMEKGILPVDEAGKPVDPEHNEVIVEAPKIVLAPDDGDEIDRQILTAIRAIVVRNNATDFAGGGHPGSSAVTAALGYRVDQKTVSKVWMKHRQAILNPEKE